MLHGLKIVSVLIRPSRCVALSLPIPLIPQSLQKTSLYLILKVHIHLIAQKLI